MTRWIATLVLAALPMVAHADPWERCDDCGDRDWVLVEPGAGPEVGTLARLELGTSGVAVGDHVLTAGVARLRLGVRLGRGLGVRASGTLQVFDAERAPFPFALGADAGGAFGLGVTRVLHTFGDLPVAATLDGELASGPAVRSGLGMRALGDGERATLAPGLAAAWDFYVGSARANLRYLRTREQAGDTAAVEASLGASMRINWARDFWGGSWPLDAWVDVRYRRGLDDDGGAREREIRGGLDYTPAGWLDRVGVQVAGSRDRLADGERVHGLTMLVTLQYGQGR